jgi:hypothetical protein
MIVRCAWCGRVVGEKPAPDGMTDGPDVETSTCCPTCAAVYFGHGEEENGE